MTLRTMTGKTSASHYKPRAFPDGTPAEVSTPTGEAAPDTCQNSGKRQMQITSRAEAAFTTSLVKTEVKISRNTLAVNLCRLYIHSRRPTES